jgi:CheY-like chemotaxis protein
MKYRIIWIDDTQTWVNSVKEDMEEAFVRFKFEPIVELFTEVNQDVRSAIDNNYLDLLIIDCNLPNLNGNDFIQELRSQRCFSHIVFYSQEAKNLTLITADTHFSHVTPRESFHEIIEQVAEQAFRKYNHPAFMRGLLLSEFIDLESLMDDLVIQCFKTEGSYFRESIVNKGGESFGLGTKQKFISRLIKDSTEKNVELKTPLEAINFTANKFQVSIIQRRNILAHAYPMYDAQTNQIKLISAFPDTNFDVNWFYETRTDIHLFKNKIKSLLNLELYKVVNP